MDRDPLEYVLNRMERAGQSNDPAGNGYGPARQELLGGIRTLRSQRDALLLRAEKAEGELDALLARLNEGEVALAMYRHNWGEPDDGDINMPQWEDVKPVYIEQARAAIAHVKGGKP